MSFEAAAELLAELGNRGLTLATCESITGGGIGTAITSVPGSSKVFRGGLITYATDLKVSLAGVDAGFVAHHGVINERTALEMAAGAARACGSDAAIAVTGVAGPDPEDGAAVGTVWVGLALPPEHGGIIALELNLTGGRDEIRSATTERALRGMLARLQSQTAL